MLEKRLKHINERMQQIQKRKQEMRNLLDVEGTDLKALETELDILLIEEKELREKIKRAEALEVTAELMEQGGEKRMGKSFIEDLKEQRAAIVSSSLVIPQHYDRNIQNKFTEVSGILDLVNTMNLQRGNSLKVPYNTANQTGGITAEGTDYTETKPEFSEAEINGIKITAYTQYSEEVEKLPIAEYQVFIENEITKSIKKKIIEQIVNGNGIQQFSGLYNTDVVKTNSDITISQIDKDTLNTIVYGHNTEAEDVEGDLVLFLNKKDLGEFAKVQTQDGTPVYNITFGDTGMTGYINGTKFCICNSLKSFKEATSEEYTMAYMNPSKYMLATFSPIELKRDYSSGFRQGLIAVKGSIVVGGSMINPFGLSRIKKA